MKDWYIDLGDGTPDSTTEAIIELDKRLTTVQHIHESLCYVCLKPGLHFHERD